MLNSLRFIFILCLAILTIISEPTSSETTSPMSTTSQPPSNSPPITRERAQPPSARDHQARIFYGEDVSDGGIPFIVRLYIYSNVYQYYYICGGSIIAENWVVTAAHCVTDFAQYQGYNHTFVQHGPNIEVIAGDINTRAEEATEVHKTASQVFCHENYNEWYLQNDIALLYFEDGFEFGDNVGAAGLGTKRPDSGSTVTVAGWGMEEDFNLATTLQETSYSVPLQITCKAHYSQYGYSVLPGMWCTGNDNMDSHSANGDSGGPIFVKEDSGSFTLYGIVSWGVDISDVGDYDYDINTDVVYFNSWITDIMADYEAYRLPLAADTTVRTISWSTGTDKLRYQVYNVSCEEGMYVKITLTELILDGDYSHVLVRDGFQYNSPVLFQQHTDLEETTSLTSSSNSMLVLVKTTHDSTNNKSLQFRYEAVSSTGSDDPHCGGYMRLCDNAWECYDPMYACDGRLTDCADASDETEEACAAAREEACSGAARCSSISLYGTVYLLLALVSWSVGVLGCF